MSIQCVWRASEQIRKIQNGNNYANFEINKCNFKIGKSLSIKGNNKSKKAKFSNWSWATYSDHIKNSSYLSKF